MTTAYGIVVGVDGFEGGERALRCGLREAAQRAGATVQPSSPKASRAPDLHLVGPLLPKVTHPAK